MESNNMNYIFNVEYFKGIENLEDISGKNKEIVTFNRFNSSPYYKDDFQSIAGYEEFSLWTLYPGLLVGTGYVHEIKYEESIKCGFSLDYTTGVPYIPGSSLKGMLRSYFPKSKEELSEEQESEKQKEENKAKYIKAILTNNSEENQSKKYESLDIVALRDDIFEGKDTFILGCPCDIENKEIMELEYITPHNKGKFKNPVPIQLMKVRPNVKFVFAFILHDSHIKNGDEDIKITAEDKKKLFQQLILDMGIGAKTNVGFGKFGENSVNASQNNQNKKIEKEVWSNTLGKQFADIFSTIK